MKVCELIEKLKQMPQDKEVYAVYDSYVCWKEIKSCYLVEDKCRELGQVVMFNLDEWSEAKTKEDSAKEGFEIIKGVKHGTPNQSPR